MEASVMKDIGTRFVRYSMSFPEEVINIGEEIKMIENGIEFTFHEDIANIKKVLNDKQIRININFKEFENNTHLLKQALYTYTKIPEKRGDLLRFYIANLYICKDVTKILIGYLEQFIIEKLRRSYEDYEKRKNNVLIRDFYEFIGCCNNIDKVITDYLRFYELIEVQLGENTKATELRFPTRYEIIGGIKQTLIKAAKTDDIMLSLVRLAVKDDNEFLEKINAIIPILNGHDPEKLVSVDYSVDKLADSKHYGRKVMTNIRYLILLYIAGQIEPFKSFGQQLDNNIYFSAVNLEKIANDKLFKPEQIIFERSRAMEDYYLRYDIGEVIHIQKGVPTRKDPSKIIRTDLVALTKKGKKRCERIVRNLQLTIPEQKRPKQKLTNVVLTHQTSSQNFEKECQSWSELASCRLF